VLKSNMMSELSDSGHRALVANNNRGYLFSKRVIDIVGSVFGIILLSWLFLITAILIKIEDHKGPVFFKQVRIGKDGKEFNMYKFRSMVTDAEEKLNELLKHNEVSGAMFKMKDDPRITKIGRFIRKTSIDELPQLWNVLKGDMSLVGPRPPLPREVAEYTPYDKQRLIVIPGCTGIWQVSGRNNVGFNEMVEMDLEYIKKRNIFLDIKIIIKTIKSVLFSKNAY
jgi:exopolysaccharide biosynthesis polyprenyl glycosylphosphotransferase